jgi:hypothetical protein
MSLTSICYILLAVICLGGLYSLYRALMSPELQYHSLGYRLKAKLFFFLGDIRRIEAFPWVTWATSSHKVCLADATRACSLSQGGFVGLHRDSGYLSNLGIPGAFKHAWIHVGDNSIVEAISEGVVKRHELYPLLTDYAVILRPVGVTGDQVAEAVRRANSIVGCEYDANFNFDLSGASDKYSANLRSGDFHGAFSCTETVAFSWYHCRKILGIFRTVYAGREAIVADDYLRMNFEIVWASESVTVEWAEKAGLHEEGRLKIKEYWDSRRRA